MLGMVVGHSCCTALAVIGGRYVSMKISVKQGTYSLPLFVLFKINTLIVMFGGSILFLIFGIIYLYEAFTMTNDMDLNIPISPSLGNHTWLVGGCYLFPASFIVELVVIYCHPRHHLLCCCQPCPFIHNPYVCLGPSFICNSSKFDSDYHMRNPCNQCMGGYSHSEGPKAKSVKGQVGFLTLRSSSSEPMRRQKTQ